MCVPQPAPRVPLCSASSALQCLFLSRHRCCSQSSLLLLLPLPFFLFFFFKQTDLSCKLPLDATLRAARRAAAAAARFLLLPAMLPLLRAQTAQCSLSIAGPMLLPHVLYCGPHLPLFFFADPMLPLLQTPCSLCCRPHTPHCGPHDPSIAGPMPPPLQTHAALPPCPC